MSARVGCSDGSVHGHHEVEHVLNGLKQVLAVIDLDSEFGLNGVVDEHASLDVHAVVFVVPVSLECDWHTIPAVSINMAKSVTADLDDALGENVRLLI